MISKSSFLVLMMVSALACIGASKAAIGREASREASSRNAQAVFKYLKPVIFSSDKPIRLYYAATCHAVRDFTLDDPVPFPFTKVQPPARGKNGLAAVRDIFKNDKNVTVTEDSAGIIRIWIGKVRTAILQTKLSRLTLDPIERYNPNDAFEAIMGTREMGVAMRSLGFDSVVRGSSTVAEPQRDLPRLPRSMRKMTVEQVLDMVAKTWAGEGYVVYGACSDPSGLPRGGKPFWIEYDGDLVPRSAPLFEKIDER